MIYNIFATEMRITPNNNIELFKLDIQNKITILMKESASYPTIKRVMLYLAMVIISFIPIIAFNIFKEKIRQFVSLNISSTHAKFIYNIMVLIIVSPFCISLLYFGYISYKSRTFQILYYVLYLKTNSMYKARILILILIIFPMILGYCAYVGIGYLLNIGK